jgi:hypothetical protein
MLNRCACGTPQIGDRIRTNRQDFRNSEIQGLGQGQQQHVHNNKSIYLRIFATTTSLDQPTSTPSALTHCYHNIGVLHGANQESAGENREILVKSKNNEYCQPVGSPPAWSATVKIERCLCWFDAGGDLTIRPQSPGLGQAQYITGLFARHVFYSDAEIIIVDLTRPNMSEYGVDKRRFATWMNMQRRIGLGVLMGRETILQQYEPGLFRN